MPNLNHLAGAIWILTIISQPLLFLILLYNGAQKRWPSMLMLIGWNTCKSFCLAALFITKNSAGYFYIYWAGDLISRIIEFWIIKQITYTFLPAWPKLRSSAQYILIALLALALTASASIAAPMHISIIEKASQFVFCIDRITSLSWCLLFIATALTAETLGYKWSDSELAITSGFALNTAGSVAFGWALTALGTSYLQQLSSAKGIFYLFAISLWTYAALQGAKDTGLNQKATSATLLAVEHARKFTHS